MKRLLDLTKLLLALAVLTLVGKIADMEVMKNPESVFPNLTNRGDADLIRFVHADYPHRSNRGCAGCGSGCGCGQGGPSGGNETGGGSGCSSGGGADA